MKGFILAAGYGERLRPVTDGIPKPLIPVVNVPSICYAVMLLREAGIRDIIINLHYRPEHIMRFFREHDNFGCSIRFSFEETILGTGGGVKKCEAMLDDDFVLLNSDVILDISLGEVIEANRRSAARGTVVLYRDPRAAEAAPVAVEGRRVIDFKNFLNTGRGSDLVYTGVAVLSPLILRYLREEFSSIVYTGYTGLISHHDLHFHEHRGLWYDIGSVESYWETSMDLLGRMERLKTRIHGACGIDMAATARDAVIAGGALVENSVTGSGCRVGPGASVVSSVLLPGSEVESGARVRNAVIYGREVLAVHGRK